MSALILAARHPQRGKLFAAVDDQAHHVEGTVAERRFSAFLSPFRDEETARAAMNDAGAEQIEPERKRRG